MAVPVQITNLLPSPRFVTPTSRYRNAQVLIYSEENKLTFSTYKRTSIPESSDDQFTVIPIGEEYRPDLTSFRAYNTVDFWWIIMQANNINDVFNYKSGLNIRIPSSTSLLL